MESIRFKSLKKITSKVIGFLFFIPGILLFILLLLTAVTTIFKGNIITMFKEIYPLYILFIFICSISLIFLANKEIEIFINFKNRINITLFSKKIFSYSTQIIYPSYISLFGQSFSKSNDFSTISALGSTSEYDLYVIRFFNNKNQREIIFKSENKKEVLEKGKQLAELLNVKLVNNI